MLKNSDIEKICSNYCENLEIFQKNNRTSINSYNVIYLYTVHIVSFIFSIFVDKYKSSKLLYLSWSKTHTSKLKIFNDPIVELNFSKIDLIKCRVYSNIKLTDIVNTFKIVQTLRYPFYLKMLFVFEYNLVLNITKNTKEIYIAGHFDRLVLLISLIAKLENKKLNIVQHGALELIDGLPKIYVSKVYYMYDFSIAYFERYYLAIDKNILYINEPKLLSDNLNFKLCKFQKHTIALITQPDKVEYNIKILTFLIKNYKNSNISIIVHPRDNKKYYKKFLSQNVFIGRSFCLDYSCVITRYSTLGVNFHKKGIKTIFINLDNVTMDFFESGEYIVINKLDSFECV